MFDLDNEVINRSDMYMRLLKPSDFNEFRRAAIESTSTNYEYLAYGALFEGLDIFSFANEYTNLLSDFQMEHWGLFHRKKLIGHIAFTSGYGPLGTEIIGWIRKGYQSRGVGEIGLKTAASLAFGHKGFNYVELRISEANMASRRVAEKVGFSPVLKIQNSISTSSDATILYLKINPELERLARMNELRPVDIMNSPSSMRPLRYLIRNENILKFYKWPFPKYRENCDPVNLFDFHGYLALINLTPDDLERFQRAQRADSSGIYGDN
jgi:RimJ/RimL family protein N-acetyltransferase